MSTREIAEGGVRWRWPDFYVWTNPATGERLVLAPDDVELAWVDR